MSFELLKQANGNKPRTEEQREEMIKNATIAYAGFLTAVGFDFEADENSKNTPHRVAKAWVNDLISGTNTEKPRLAHFPTSYKGIIFDGDIDVVSMCSHHNLSFTGKAYVAYIPGEQAVGLSKLNRIVDWYSRRPQIQESLTQQIAQELSEQLPGNKGVIVLVHAKHSCCSHRGIKHKSGMITAEPTGYFLENKDGCKDEFYKMIDLIKLDK